MTTVLASLGQCGPRAGVNDSFVFDTKQLLETLAMKGTEKVLEEFYDAFTKVGVWWHKKDSHYAGVDKHGTGNIKAQILGRRVLVGMHTLDACSQCGSKDPALALEFLAEVTPDTASDLSTFFFMEIGEGDLYYIPMGFITLDLVPGPVTIYRSFGLVKPSSYTRPQLPNAGMKQTTT